MSDWREFGALGAILAALPFVFGASGYYSRLLDLFLLFALLATALNIVFGHTDQLFLFVGGLSGVGAYTTALAADALAVSAWIALPAGVLLCGAIGALVSWVSAKRNFTVILISILTLTLQLALVAFFVGARSITGGSTGFPFESLGLAGTAAAIGISRNYVLYYLLLVFLLAVLLSYRRLIDSRYGLAFDALREDELAAESVGIDVVRYKTLAGFVSAAVIGATGVFYAGFEGYITPSLFAFLQVDVLVLIMLVLGGLRTTFGPVVGAALVVAIREVLQISTEYQTAIFGALLIVLFLYFRSGVIPAVGDGLDRLDLPFGGNEADERTESGERAEPEEP
jgi:branched-chain amino acid transport system permease protein